MPQFNKGDRVLVDPDALYSVGSVGFRIQGKHVIVSNPVPSTAGDIIVDFEGDRWFVNPKYLTFVFDPGGEKIAFDDVKAGDTVAALTYGQWRVAEMRDVLGALTEADNVLAYNDDNTTDIRLLHRPEPKVDAAQVAALKALILAGDTHTIHDIAETLVKAGVSVDV